MDRLLCPGRYKQTVVSHNHDSMAFILLYLKNIHEYSTYVWYKPEEHNENSIADFLAYSVPATTV